MSIGLLEIDSERVRVLWFWLDWAIGNMACHFCNFEAKLHVLALSFSSGGCRMDYTLHALVFDMSYLYLFGKSKIVMP